MLYSIIFYTTKSLYFFLYRLHCQLINSYIFRILFIRLAGWAFSAATNRFDFQQLAVSTLEFTFLIGDA